MMDDGVRCMALLVGCTRGRSTEDAIYYSFGSTLPCGVYIALALADQKRSQLSPSLLTPFIVTWRLLDSS